MASLDTPTSHGDRIEALDVIRGVALCGLVPMNIPDFAFAEDLVFSPGSLAGFDLALWNVLAVLCSGKFMALFSLLFGAGIILSTAKRDASGEPVTVRYMKRLGWLWFFGMLHAYLIWHGDILVAYAVTGFVVFWCRRWKVKTQVICGVLMYSVLPVLAALLVFIFPLSYFGTPLLAVGYASLLMLWIKARPRGVLQAALGSLGRMAFSNYIGQSVILGLIFYGHGLGLYNHLPYTAMMAIVPAVWVLQAVFSVLWMRSFRFGPLEWIWRCLTYGERFPLRREA